MTSRLENDLFAFTAVRSILKEQAQILLTDLNIISLIQKEPASLNKICVRSKVKHKIMLENILDFLVGEKILIFKNKKYSINKLDTNIPDQHKRFLEENYAESLEWIHFVNQFSKQTLKTGNAPNLTGFENEKAIFYWDKIMEQSPYSLRELAIIELFKNIKENAVVLDYGCGGGIGIEQIIKLSTKDITLFGTDPSKKYFKKATQRIKKIQPKNKTQERNIKKTTFVPFNKIHELDGEIDAIFISIIFNHIPSKDYIKVFKELKKLLNPEGKLYIVQLLDNEKFQRNPIWVMHNIPTHVGYPDKNKFISDLNKVFKKVEDRLDGIITISAK